MIKEVVVYTFTQTDETKLRELFNERDTWLKTLDGFVSIETIKSDTEVGQFIDYVEWRDMDVFSDASKQFETASCAIEMMAITDMKKTFVMSAGSVFSSSKK
jgi:heme-degrading monooxygenase HmoA